MRRTLAPLLFLFSLHACANAPSSDEQGVSTKQGPFPEAWIGSWQGEVTGYGPKGERMRFDMTRIIAPTEQPDRFAWTTIYEGEAGKQVREYTLIVRDRSTGDFAIDEHNGIVLDARYLHDTLYSWFEVQGTRLIARERLVQSGAGLAFEIATSQGEAVLSGEEIPVINYLTTGLQRAVLRRVSLGIVP